MGLSIASLFGCAVCGAVAAVMTVVDLVVNVSKGDWGAAAMDVAGLVTFGAGAAIKSGMETARTAARLAPGVANAAAKSVRTFQTAEWAVTGVDIAMLGNDANQFANDKMK